MSGVTPHQGLLPRGDFNYQRGDEVTWMRHGDSGLLYGRRQGFTR
jgi:hypothetical protein